MFSWGDLYSISETWKETKDSNKDVVVEMIVAYDKNNPSQPLVYAMTINDMNTLEAKLNQDLAATEGANIDAKRKKLNDKQVLEYDKNKNNLEKYFLQKYGSYGISLYNANEDVSNWSKLDLAPGTGINGSVVLPEPCN